MLPATDLYLMGRDHAGGHNAPPRVVPAEMAECLAMATARAAVIRQRADCGLKPGNAADFVILDAVDPRHGGRRVVPVLHAFKRGRIERYLQPGDAAQARLR